MTLETPGTLVTVSGITGVWRVMCKMDSGMICCVKQGKARAIRPHVAGDRGADTGPGRYFSADRLSVVGRA